MFCATGEEKAFLVDSGGSVGQESVKKIAPTTSVGELVLSQTQLVNCETAFNRRLSFSNSIAARNSFCPGRFPQGLHFDKRGLLKLYQAIFFSRSIGVPPGRQKRSE